MVSKKRVVKKKCSECGKPCDPKSKFCKHCGNKVVKFKRKHKCPTCNGIIEEFSKFCKHCGASIGQLIHSGFVRVLLFFMMFLVVVLALLIVFSPTLINFEGVVSEESGVDLTSEFSEPFLKIGDASCVWEDNEFKVCANVNWNGDVNDYVQCSFAGNVDAKKWVSSPLTCCNKVGVEEGPNLIRSFLADGEGNFYKDVGTTVTCSGVPSPTTSVNFASKKNYAKSFWFTASMDRSPAYGSGSKVIDFPEKIKSCEVSGRWVTKRVPFKSYEESSFCTGAEGNFLGSVDLFGQSVFSDPGYFSWAGEDKPSFDPVGLTHEGYGVYATLCDLNYNQGPRYNVNGVFRGFDTNTITLDWEYYSNYPRPDVDFFISMECKSH